MSATRKPKPPIEIPEWVKATCACPVCGESLHRTVSRDYVACRKVPAHTGLVRWKMFLTTLLLAEKANATKPSALSRLSAPIKRAALKVLERKIPMTIAEE